MSNNTPSEDTGQKSTDKLPKVFIMVKIVALLIPALLSIALFVFIITDSASENKKAHSYEPDKTYEDGYNDAVEKIKDTLDLGITIIGIAVSVWIGLNIYNVIEKDQLQYLSEGLKSAEQKLNTLRDDLDAIKNEKIMLFAEVDEKTEDLDIVLNILRINSLALSFQVDELPTRLIKDKLFEVIENRYANVKASSAKMISLYGMIENAYANLLKNESIESKIKFGEKGYKICELLLNKKESNESDLNLSEEEEFYLQYRMGELCYYLAENLNEREPKKALDYLEKSVKYYTKVKNIRYLNEDGYIDNTLGGVYLWIAQNKKEQTDKDLNNKLALEYFNKAINKFDKRGIYYRQKGVALQRLNLDSMAVINCYKTAIELDEFYKKPYYRNYVALAGIYLKQLVGIMKIPSLDERNEPLSDWVDQHNEPWDTSIPKRIEEIKELYNTAIKIGTKNIEPYYKLAQLLCYEYIYYYKSDKDKADLAKKSSLENLNMAEKIDSKFIAAKFAKRNFYEITGDINKAKEVNASIIGNGGDSVSWESKFGK